MSDDAFDNVAKEEESAQPSKKKGKSVAESAPVVAEPAPKPIELSAADKLRHAIQDVAYVQGSYPDAAPYLQKAINELDIALAIVKR